MSEIWKNIEGYPGYQVSNLGHVRSFKKWRSAELNDEPRMISLRWIGTKSKYLAWFVGCSRTRRKVFYVHRLVYQAFAGDIPEGYQIDHIDRDRNNNSFENLRLATVHQNRMNSPLRKNVTSKYLGVALFRNGKWRTSIQVKGKIRHIGYFVAEEEAAKAYDKAAREILQDEDIQFFQFNFPN